MNGMTYRIPITGIVSMILLTVLIGCQEVKQETPSCDAGTFRNELYINTSMGFSIQLPQGWSAIPDSVIERRKKLGAQAVRETIIPNSEIVLFALQDNRHGQESMLQFSCLTMAVVGKFKTAGQYAQYSLDVMNRAKDRTSVRIIGGRDTAEYGGQKLERVWMHFGEGDRITKVDVYYLFRNNRVLSIVAAYTNTPDSIRLNRILKNMVFEPDPST